MATTLEIIRASNGPDEIIIIPYEHAEPISVLLQRIHATFESDDTSIFRRDLFLNGMRLKDHTQTLEHYRIFGHTLTCRAVPAPAQNQDQDQREMSIQITTPTGRLILLTCHPSLLIEDVKQLLEEREGIFSDLQTLTYAGMQLEDSRALSCYRVFDGSFLHLFLPRPTHVTFPGIVFTDDSAAYLGVRRIRFSADAPLGRVPAAGANVECSCECAPAHRVICQKSHGTLELTNATLICPNCGTSDKITPVAVGFLKCKYRFHGIRATDGKQFTSPWRYVQADEHYHLVNADNQGTFWRRLVMESVRLDACEACTICLEPLQEVEALNCGHRFHAACVKRWEGFCPNCKYNHHLIADAVVEITGAVEEVPGAAEEDTGSVVEVTEAFAEIADASSEVADASSEVADAFAGSEEYHMAQSETV